MKYSTNLEKGENETRILHINLIFLSHLEEVSDTIPRDDLESSTSSDSDVSIDDNDETVSAIGIDLDTVNLCVGIYRNGQVEIIPNEQGNRLTPSYVAFTDHGRLIGDEAKKQSSINPEKTIFHSKRLIGRKFHDSIVQSNVKQWPFKVKIEVQYQNQIKLFTLEEISSMILIKMKQIAESYLGHTINSAVITVLTSVNDSQPAAIAYGLDKQKVSREKNLLVYDLSGGTFNVSIVSLMKGIFEVKSTIDYGDCGGEDHVNPMIKYLIKESLLRHFASSEKNVF
ncbi:hypothetical protein I4U23_016491 [Adineta vaga]|nr:hypothetical protein I4U23_016491 [Adineta vaga]